MSASVLHTSTICKYFETQVLDYHSKVQLLFFQSQNTYCIIQFKQFPILIWVVDFFSPPITHILLFLLLFILFLQFAHRIDD